jgi:hypothetical protein
MNKKILSALVALTLIVPISANAASLRNKTVAQPTIAILDTAIDTSIPSIKDRIIFEACVTQWSTCPNGLKEMEGQNSAILPTEFLSKNGFDHGTQMASLAIATNPNINIVFVRIIGINSKGFRQASGEQTVYNALDWVLRNKDRFNIQAVSLSQSHHNLGAVGTDYCPKTPITEGKIKELLDSNIPLFVSAGNNGDYSRVDWPSCIPSAVSIGSTMPTKTVAPYSNFDPLLLDFFTQGTTKATTVGNKQIPVAGTSASTVIAATQWATIKAAKSHLTYSQIYDLISRTALPTSNSKVKGGKLINMEAAING